MQGPSSCVRWPTFFPSAKTDERGFKDRICPYWRMVPGVITLAGLIIAITCALIWNSPYLTLAFVPGVLGSIYLIYLGIDFNDLKTAAENNSELKKRIDDVTGITVNLSGTLEKYNKYFQEWYTMANTVSEEKDKQIENLLVSNKEFKETGDLILDKFSKQFSSLIQQINECLNTETAKKLKEEQQLVLVELKKLNIELLNTQEQLGFLKGTVGFLKGTAEELEKQVKELTKTKEGINALLDKLLPLLEKISLMSDSLPDKETMEQFKSAFQILKECKIVIPSKEEEK